MVDRGDRSYIAPVHINAKAFLSHVDCYVVSYVYTFVGSGFKWVLPTTLRTLQWVLATTLRILQWVLPTTLRTLKWVLPTTLRTLKWVLPTTLRVYGLRPSGKTTGSVYGLRPSGKTRGSASDRMTKGGLCICSSILICSLMPSWMRALQWKRPAS